MSTKKRMNKHIYYDYLEINLDMTGVWNRKRISISYLIAVFINLSIVRVLVLWRVRVSVGFRVCLRDFSMIQVSLSLAKKIDHSSLKFAK